jgi:hypothetical protein
LKKLRLPKGSPSEVKNMVGNQPIEKFRHGSCEAAIFENEIKKNGSTFTVRKVVFQRNYLDKNDKWQSTSSLDINDVPKAILVLSKAYDFLTRSDTTKSKNMEVEELA